MRYGWGNSLHAGSMTRGGTPTPIADASHRRSQSRTPPPPAGEGEGEGEGAGAQSLRGCQPSRSLPIGPADHGHQFRDLFPLIGLVAAGDRMFDAMRHVIPQHLFLDAPQRGAYRGNLRHDVDAVAVLVDHFRQAANLALDPAQALLTGSLDVFSHPSYIPLQGMGYKARGDND